MPSEVVAGSDASHEERAADPAARSEDYKYMRLRFSGGTPLPARRMTVYRGGLRCVARDVLDSYMRARRMSAGRLWRAIPGWCSSTLECFFDRKIWIAGRFQFGLPVMVQSGRSKQRPRISLPSTSLPQGCRACLFKVLSGFAN